MTVAKRGNKPVEPYECLIVMELTKALRQRLPFDMAWDRAMQRHSPPSEWTTDVAQTEDSIPNIKFLENTCRAHYEYRLAELEGDPLDFEPPVYAIFIKEQNDDTSWEQVRSAPTPSGARWKQ